MRGSHSFFTLQTHHTCLHLVSVHHSAPPLLTSDSIWLQLTTHLLSPKRMQGWVGWDGWRQTEDVMRKTWCDGCKQDIKSSLDSERDWNKLGWKSCFTWIMTMRMVCVCVVCWCVTRGCCSLCMVLVLMCLLHLTFLSIFWQYHWYIETKARFPLPELTDRVDGPWTRVHFLTPVNSGRQEMHQNSRAVKSARELG